MMTSRKLTCCLLQGCEYCPSLLFVIWSMVCFCLLLPPRAACEILVPWPGTEPVPPAVQCGVLTTELPGESLLWLLKYLHYPIWFWSQTMLNHLFPDLGVSYLASPSSNLVGVFFFFLRVSELFLNVTKAHSPGIWKGRRAEALSWGLWIFFVVYSLCRTYKSKLILT